MSNGKNTAALATASEILDGIMAEAGAVVDMNGTDPHTGTMRKFYLLGTALQHIVGVLSTVSTAKEAAKAPVPTAKVKAPKAK